MERPSTRPTAPSPARRAATTPGPTRPAPGGRTQLAFHASRIIIDVGVLIAMAAMSLPFVTTEGSDLNSIDADALPVILLLAPIFLITLIPDHTRPIPRPLGWLSLILGIAALPYAIVKYFDATALAETLEGDVGIGARLLVLGTFVTLVGIGVGLTRNLLRLPQGGTYPSRPRPPEPADPVSTRRPVRAARQQPAAPDQQPRVPGQPARTARSMPPATTREKPGGPTPPARRPPAEPGSPDRPG